MMLKTVGRSAPPRQLKKLRDFSRGAVLYDGPSLIDGEPIVVIATGVVLPSQNIKTGPMVQVWVLRRDESPQDAVKSGNDVSACGGCPLRNGACYVLMWRGPKQVYESFVAGNYGDATDTENIALIGRGQYVRGGAYGDPAAAPLEVWEALFSECAGWSGYTHQWRQRRVWPYMKYFMASCENANSHHRAIELGFRPYTILARGAELIEGSVLCPHHSNGTQCINCLMCNGINNAPPIVSYPAGGKSKEGYFS